MAGLDLVDDGGGLGGAVSAAGGEGPLQLTALSVSPQTLLRGSVSDATTMLSAADLGCFTVVVGDGVMRLLLGWGRYSPA